MTPETSAKVEALYASGKVQRPTEMGWPIGMEHGEWVWRHPEKRKFYTFAWEPEPVIGWSLVCACWARGWRIEWLFDKAYVLAPATFGPFSVLATDPDPIIAMIAALNGGG